MHLHLFLPNQFSIVHITKEVIVLIFTECNCFTHVRAQRLTQNQEQRTRIWFQLSWPVAQEAVAQTTSWNSQRENQLFRYFSFSKPAVGLQEIRKLPHIHTKISLLIQTNLPNWVLMISCKMINAYLLRFLLSSILAWCGFLIYKIQKLRHTSQFISQLVYLKPVSP